MSYASFGLRLSPRGIDPVIIAHEIAHIELHGRLGLARFLAGAIPAWFDEGLAVVVSDDPRYLRPSGSGDRCLVAPTSELPADMAGWNRQAGSEHDLYARAACRVLHWMDSNGGRDGLMILINRVAAGKNFSALYRDSLLHQF